MVVPMLTDKLDKITHFLKQISMDSGTEDIATELISAFFFSTSISDGIKVL